MKSLIIFFKAMGEETRVKIISMLLEEEMCLCELIDRLSLSQSAVSHHVKILKQAELVRDRRCGKWSYYSINKRGFEAHVSNFHGTLTSPLKNYEYVAKQNDNIKCNTSS